MGMMPVMSVRRRGRKLHMTIPFVAMLSAGFQLKGCVSDAVRKQLFPDFGLHFMRVAIGNDMHRSKVVISIHTPNVDMVYIQNAVDFTDVLFDFRYFNITGRFFQKQIHDFL